MATYKEIFGKQIKVLASDPTNEAEGQIWYNTASDSFKTVLVSEAWSSGAPLITGRNLLGRAGTQTAALAISGYDISPGNPPQVRANVESYDGSGWSEGPDVNTARYGMQGDGSQTAAIIAGGISPAAPEYKNATETYDGSSRTTSPSTINTTRGYVAHAGGPAASTASLIFGGRIPPGPASTTSSESWNGSSWTATPSLNDTGWGRYGCGTTTAALAIGLTPPAAGTTEEYNGSSWTTVTTSPTGRAFRGVAGIQTAALAFGSDAPTITTTEAYDGTNWSAKPALATARGDAGGTGTATAGLCFGNVGQGTVTEEFNQSGSVITAGAWASGGAIPEVKRDGAGQGVIGTQDAGLAFGGEPINTSTWEYASSAWTAGGAMNTGRRLGGGFGTQTAAGCAGGNTSAGDGYSDAYETYNGTAWTTSPLALTTTRRGNGGAGTTTAGLTFGGQTPPNPTYITATEEFDGEAWTAGGVMPVAKQYMGSGGTQTAAISGGGNIGPYPSYTDVLTSEEYNGTAWAAGGTLTEFKLVAASAGTQTAFMYATGKNQITPEVRTTGCQTYDGAVWSTAPNVGTAQAGIRGSGGTSTSAYYGGGFNPSGSNVGTTEEFTGETTALNYKTITTS